MSWIEERGVTLESWEKLHDDLANCYRRVQTLREGLDQMACAESEVVRNHVTRVLRKDNNWRDK